MPHPDLQELTRILSQKRLEDIPADDIGRFKRHADRLPNYARILEEHWLHAACVASDAFFKELVLGSSEWFVSTSSCDIDQQAFPLYQPAQYSTLFTALNAGVKVNILVANSEPAQSATATVFDTVRGSGVTGHLAAYMVPQEKVATIGGFNPNLWAAFELLTLTHQKAAQVGYAIAMLNFHHAATHTYDDELNEQPSESTWIRTNRRVGTDIVSAMPRLRQGLRQLDIYDQLRVKTVRRSKKS